MNIKDTEQSYGSITRLFHWLMAAGFAFMYFTAIAWNISEDNYSLMPYHKAVGFILLLLLLARAVWMLLNLKNRPHASVAAKLGHLALYGLMLLIPVLGALRTYGFDKPLKVFGVTVFDKPGFETPWMQQASNPHGPLGWILLLLVIGHVGMALLHQMKGERILNRMIGS